MSKKALWQINWHFWFVYIFIVALIFLIAGPFLAKTAPKLAMIFPGIANLFLIAMALLSVFAILLLIHKIVSASVENTDKLENVIQTLSKQNEILSQISHGVRLSETAKAIVFRDMDRQSLREAVLEKLHQQDYQATYATIDDIAKRPGYETLASQLRSESDSYRSATQEEQISQAISHVEKLCDQFQWTKATNQAQRLMKSYPAHHRVQSLINTIADRRLQRKKELLAQWDDAVKRQATDESIAILRDLDLYLTPNEGLAMQDAARDVFRSKLHGMGVQFSMAVTEKRWDDALNIGQQITTDFPNTRMAGEIREKIDILKNKAGKV